jgi:hypothetical protein
MSRQSWLICGGAVAIAALAFAVFRGPEQARAAPPEDRSFAAGSVVRVTMQTPVQQEEFLSEPKVYRLGDRPFVVGRRFTSTALVWLPLSDVKMIEEFPNLEEMSKVHRVPGTKK